MNILTEKDLIRAGQVQSMDGIQYDLYKIPIVKLQISEIDEELNNKFRVIDDIGQVDDSNEYLYIVDITSEKQIFHIFELGHFTKKSKILHTKERNEMMELVDLKFSEMKALYVPLISIIKCLNNDNKELNEDIEKMKAVLDAYYYSRKCVKDICKEFNISIETFTKIIRFRYKKLKDINIVRTRKLNNNEREMCLTYDELNKEDIESYAYSMKEYYKLGFPRPFVDAYFKENNKEDLYKLIFNKLNKLKLLQKYSLYNKLETGEDKYFDITYELYKKSN